MSDAHSVASRPRTHGILETFSRSSHFLFMTRHVTAHAERCNAAGKPHATIDHAHTRARFPMTYLLPRRANRLRRPGKRAYARRFVFFPLSGVIPHRHDDPPDQQRKPEGCIGGETNENGTRVVTPTSYVAFRTFDKLLHSRCKPTIPRYIVPLFFPSRSTSDTRPVDGRRRVIDNSARSIAYACFVTRLITRSY